MGLGGGPNGAKAVFLNKFSGAFANVKRLDDVRQLVGAGRSNTLVVMDGNVMMNAIPSSVDTFRGYVRILANQLNEAVQAAAHVVVVFRRAQGHDARQGRRAAPPRRDCARRACRSAPGTSWPPSLTTTTTPTTCAPTGATSSCSWSFGRRGRASSTRCAPSCCSKFRAEMTGDGAWSLTFDGVDRRGGDRGIGTCRARRASSRATTRSGSRYSRAPSPSARATSS